MMNNQNHKVNYYKIHKLTLEPLIGFGVGDLHAIQGASSKKEENFKFSCVTRGVTDETPYSTYYCPTIMRTSLSLPLLWSIFYDLYICRCNRK